uniref:Retroviral nucleocapsid Gag protein p24 C-terminal domain-containing protein n=1 Tax=Callithrix jacchus TaxID=9483 RepID=A0A8I3W2Q6_CALJA
MLQALIFTAPFLPLLLRIPLLLINLALMVEGAAVMYHLLIHRSGLGPGVGDGGARDRGVGSGGIENSVPRETQVCALGTPVTLSPQELTDLLAAATRPVQAFPVVTTPSVKPVIRYTPEAPISATTYAFDSMERGFPDSDLHFVCPLVELTNQQGQVICHYEPIPPKFLKDFKEAVAQYRLTAPYTLSLLENFGLQAMTPMDWNCVAQACLSWGDYLLWRAYYDDAAFDATQRNARQRNNITYSMLRGSGQYEDIQAQIALRDQALAQVNLLSLQAWRKLPTHGEMTDEITKIKQGTDEPYQNFVSRLMHAVKRQLGDGDTSTLLIKQLAFENANTTC